MNVPAWLSPAERARVAPLLADMSRVERELLELAEGPAHYARLHEQLEAEVDRALGFAWDAIDRTAAGGWGLPPGLLIRELLDAVAWAAMSYASPAELETALRWVLSSADSQFNQRRKSRDSRT